MALNRLRASTLLMLVAAACGRATPAPTPTSEEPESLSVTRWTETIELFAEYPPLVVGETSRIAIHLTNLDPFGAVTEGRVEVRLRGGGSDAVFRADGPSRPGIFRVDVRPTQAGMGDMVIVLQRAGLDERLPVGTVTVHPTTDAARASSPKGDDQEAGISFLKEQQWSLDFGTAVVTAQTLRQSIQVPAQLEPRPGGAADIAAPIDGRLTRVLDFPLGSTVQEGQELARVLPPPAIPGDLPQLQRARSEAQSTLVLAVRDRERAERLTEAGAAPQKRLDEARTVEDQMTTRLSAAEASLAQYHATRSGGGFSGDGLFIVRAPVSGVIARRDAAAGANVTARTTLFRVVDASRVHVVGHIPEAEAARARLTKAAEIDVPGQRDRVSVGKPASIGRVLDPQSRTLPIAFRLDNRALGLPVGQSVLLHLLLDAEDPRPVIPATAIVDDAGRPIVFVQREGETFERRAVTLGSREGDRVQVLEGVEPGERVVSRGAYLVRLASLSTSVPAHGHVH